MQREEKRARSIDTVVVISECKARVSLNRGKTVLKTERRQAQKEEAFLRGSLRRSKRKKTDQRRKKKENKKAGIS